jgi:hypothetical protein
MMDAPMERNKNKAGQVLKLKALRSVVALVVCPNLRSAYCL